MKKVAAAVWQFLDGWKLVGAVVALAGVKVYDAMNGTHLATFAQAILIAMGIDPSGLGVDFGQLVPALMIVVGVTHKLVKAQRQRAAGSSFTGLLTTEGAVQEYIDKAQKRG